jgi:hypothetical protein
MLVGAALEHDPEKWEPVFGNDHAQTKISTPKLHTNDATNDALARYGLWA